MTRITRIKYKSSESADSYPRHPRNPRFLACLAAGLVLLGQQCLAQTTFRWKLAPGDKLAVGMTQTTDSTVAYSGKKTATKIEVTAQLTWNVLEAKEGQFKIEQSLDRLTLVIEAPAAGRIEYDSDPQARNSPSAADIAAAVKPLLQTKLLLTMSERGEVLGAAPQTPGEPAGEAKSDTDSSLLSKQTVQQLLKQPLVVLPANAVSLGDTWTTSSDLATAIGKAKQTTAYRYAGTAAEAGAGKFDQIAFTSKLQLTPAAGSKLTLKEHRHSGTIEFDSAAGRVASAEQSQKLVTERPYAATTIVVTLDSRQTTTVTPKADAPSPAGRGPG